MKTIRVKSSGPSLHFALEDSEGQRSPRKFSARSNRLTVIPVVYAKSMYNEPSIIKWIKDGKLIIEEGKEQLEELAIEESYIDSPVESVNQKELVNILTGSNLTKIKELLKGENRQLAFDLAAANYQDLSQVVVAEIEDEFGVSLTND